MRADSLAWRMQEAMRQPFLAIVGIVIPWTVFAPIRCGAFHVALRSLDLVAH